MMEVVMVIVMVMVLPQTRNPGPVPVFLLQEDWMDRSARSRFEMFRDSDLELAA
jgi:hypothetical protein